MVSSARAFLVALCMLAFGSLPGRAEPVSIETAAAAQVNVSQGFLVNGRLVRVEAFRSPLSGRHPAVIMLYGANARASGTLLAPLTRMLQGLGISGYIVHYADGVGGENWAAPTRSELRDKVLDDVVTYVAKLRDTDPDRIGVFGLSTGAFTALERATRDPRIKVVVDMVGGLPLSVDRSAVRQMPPTMILHGGNDVTVPAVRAFELADFLRIVGAEGEFHFYPDQGHSFQGAALADASRHAAGFFMRHLLPRAQMPEGYGTLRAPTTVAFVRHGIQQAKLP